MSDQKPNKPKIIQEEDEATVVVPPAKPLPSGPRREAGDGAAVPREVAVLPVRNMVIFPGTVVPLVIGREKSRRLLADVLPEEKIIVTVCQRDPKVDEPAPDDLYSFGTSAMVLKLLQVSEDHQSIVVHGLTRVRIKRWLAAEPYLRAEVEVIEDEVRQDTETEALAVSARNLAARVIDLAPDIPEEAKVVLSNIDQPGPLADFLAANIQMDVATKQKLLESPAVTERLRTVCVELERQVQVLELSGKIRKQVQEKVDKTQREFFLNEQLKAIQKELGLADEKSAEIEELEGKIKAAQIGEAVEAEALRELDRLRRIPAASPEYGVLRTYLDLMVELPWNRATPDKLDVNRARRILDRDHYDLEKVKRRILEFLAVRKLAPGSRGPILCFVGPPGVGKTSLGQSIAAALGRRFIRMSLGGMRDEAELRGHRRTYVGAMPGRVIQELRKAGSNNPVFMLDELDKVGADFRGDPTSALLEVLDPAQNSTFQDHYLNVPFDLSRVLFIGTANYMGPVPPALRDRMEVIELPGYTQQEKLRIARKYLVPRQVKENGLLADQARWTDEAIRHIIESYTREAGVRELERQIGSVCRSLAAMVAAGTARSRTITPRFAAKMLGPRKYEGELAMRTCLPGVATGLAYTPTGGEIIFVEATAFPGKGALTVTGQVGDVMKESAMAAFSLLRARAAKLGLDPSRFAQADVHVHVPAGAVPKDGPSAGAAIFTALASLAAGREVRADVAMTGEITLRGLVLPVGGIKEKVLAAQRAGIRTVILPARNRKDLADVPAAARKSLQFRFAKDVDDVLRNAINRPPARRRGRKAT